MTAPAQPVQGIEAVAIAKECAQWLEVIMEETGWKEPDDARLIAASIAKAKALPREAPAAVAWPDCWRVRAHGNWLYFTDEETAFGSAEMHGTDAQPLYASPAPAPEAHAGWQAAIKLALDWDERRNYLMPYAVRDKLRAALATQADATKGSDVPTD